MDEKKAKRGRENKKECRMGRNPVNEKERSGEKRVREKRRNKRGKVGEIGEIEKSKEWVEKGRKKISFFSPFFLPKG